MASGDVVFEATNYLIESAHFDRNAVPSDRGSRTDVSLRAVSNTSLTVPADTASMNHSPGGVTFSVFNSESVDNNNPPNLIDLTKRYKVTVTEV